MTDHKPNKMLCVMTYTVTCKRDNAVLREVTYMAGDIVKQESRAYDTPEAANAAAAEMAEPHETLSKNFAFHSSVAVFRQPDFSYVIPRAFDVPVWPDHRLDSSESGALRFTVRVFARNAVEAAKLASATIKHDLPHLKLYAGGGKESEDQSNRTQQMEDYPPEATQGLSQFVPTPFSPDQSDDGAMGQMRDLYVPFMAENCPRCYHIWWTPSTYGNGAHTKINCSRCGYLLTPEHGYQRHGGPDLRTAEQKERDQFDHGTGL